LNYNSLGIYGRTQEIKFLKKLHTPCLEFLFFIILRERIIIWLKNRRLGISSKIIITMKLHSKL